jgi:hypothetical protein
MIILRLLALIVAIAAAIDPALQLRRPVPVPVRLAAEDRDPDASAAAAKLRASLAGRVDFVDSGSAVASVVIGGAGADAALAGQGPVSVVSLDEPPSVATVHTPSTISLMPGSAVDVPATLQAVGLAGRTSVVVLEQDGVELARVEHAWTSDGSTTVLLPYIAPLPGARRLTIRVEAAVGEKRLRDNRADVLAMATARQARIAVVEARPSWSAAFARRALEADPAVEISSLLRTSRAITSRAGDPPPVVQAEQLWRFDVVIVGSPEDLQRSEVDALWRFAERRGGTVVLLPDKSPAGPYAERLPGKPSEHLFSEPRVLEPAGVAASEVVSLGVLPRGGRALATLENAPVILSWPVGDGRIAFSGALDAWRYRADPKSRLGRFWRNELLSAAFNAPPPVRIDVAPAVVRPGELVRLNVRLRRTEWVEAEGKAAETRLPAIDARVSDPSGNLEMIRLWPDTETGTFRGEVPVTAPGIHTIRVQTERAAAETTILADASASAAASDSANLQDVPALTGGVAVAASQMDPLIQHLSSLPRPSLPTAVHPFRSAWWSWLFAALLCGEWARRRRVGLR